MNSNDIGILGVRFHATKADDVVSTGLRSRGLIVIPSAPVLVRMTEDPAHHEALLNADMAITDSGLMVLLWQLLTGIKLERVSGLEYLKLLLKKLEFGVRSSEFDNTGRVLWVMPTTEARDRNVAWLRLNGHATTVEDCYVAPKYPAEGELSDEILLTMVQTRRPAHIIICLGGGVQERLGYALKRGLAANDQPLVSSHERCYRPGIHCVGAAIGFMTGDQVRIPMLADYFYLGWLFRILSNPRLYCPRYWKAARLVGLMWRYRENAPPVRGGKRET